MKKAQFNKNIYDNGFVKYAAGQQYDLTDDTQRQVRRGHAEIVDVKVARKGTAKQIAAAKKALAAAEDAANAAHAALNVATDADVPAAQEAVSAAEAEVEAAQSALADLESDE